MRHSIFARSGGRHWGGRFLFRISAARQFIDGTGDNCAGELIITQPRVVIGQIPATYLDKSRMFKARQHFKSMCQPFVNHIFDISFRQRNVTCRKPTDILAIIQDFDRCFVILILWVSLQSQPLTFHFSVNYFLRVRTVVDMVDT